MINNFLSFMKVLKLDSEQKNDISSKKLAEIKCLIQENYNTWWKFAEKSSISQAYMCRIKRSLDSKWDFESFRVGECELKSKFAEKLK